MKHLDGVMASEHIAQHAFTSHAAAEGSGHWHCFYNRGIIPKEWLEIPAPPEEELVAELRAHFKPQQYLLALSQSMREPVLFGDARPNAESNRQVWGYGDGSGGPHSADLGLGRACFGTWTTTIGKLGGPEAGTWWAAGRA